MRETWVLSLGWEDPLEKEMATHSSILAWRIPWAEEPGGLQSTGSQRVRHDWVISLSQNFDFNLINIVSACLTWVLDWKPSRGMLCNPYLSLYPPVLRYAAYVCWMRWSSCHSVMSDSLWSRGLPGCSVHGRFFRQESWSGVPVPSAEDLPNSGIEPRSTIPQADSLPSEPSEKHAVYVCWMRW